VEHLWNRFLKWWHGWGRPALAVVAVLLAVGLTTGAILEFVDGDWTTGFGAIIAAAPLVTMSLGLFMTARNEPEMVLCTSDEEIKEFMRGFIGKGTNAHVASHNLSWVRGDPLMQQFLEAKGNSVKIFLGEADETTNQLSKAGCHIVPYRTDDERPRFTLLNRGRRGSERLAVVRRPLPYHWIDIYNADRHPQVIALADAYLRYAENSP
jgi:hypothetical protein